MKKMPSTSSPKETLFLQTVPDHLVRAGIPRTDRPYQRIIDIAHVQPTFDQLIPGASLRSVTLLGVLATRLVDYWERFFIEVETNEGVNCSHFVCHMGNVAIVNLLHSVQLLDKLQGEVIESDRLLPHHVGVIATSEDLKDPEGFDHFMHTGLGLGDGEWLNVKGLQGNLAISRIDDDVAYHRRKVLPLYCKRVGIDYDPNNVMLYDNGPIDN